MQDKIDPTPLKWQMKSKMYNRVRSAMYKASQLAGRDPTDVDVAPLPAC